MYMSFLVFKIIVKLIIAVILYNKIYTIAVRNSSKLQLIFIAIGRFSIELFEMYNEHSQIIQTLRFSKTESIFLSQ